MTNHVDRERSARRTAAIVERLKLAFPDYQVAERPTTSSDPSDRDFRVFTTKPPDYVLRVTHELLIDDLELGEDRLDDAIELMKSNPGKVVKLYSDGSPELGGRT